VQAKRVEASRRRAEALKVQARRVEASRRRAEAPKVKAKRVEASRRRAEILKVKAKRVEASQNKQSQIICGSFRSGWDTGAQTSESLAEQSGVLSDARQLAHSVGVDRRIGVGLSGSRLCNRGIGGSPPRDARVFSRRAWSGANLRGSGGRSDGVSPRR